ncbi:MULTISPECIES: LLM class flavin-dependent oxidoreductase [unclassified Solwaraspora]|uniref:LLM class flavin-dependent oxidoreductase n=1 Tax=unclassified Solwaraspora TaxID=2627926 RepID=UPI00259B7727|nr:LLM class flavin-dependent oxidoreductase [Solwaraspora sp. WMMA2056]WJK38209.1 LLM class flavin-dependent oxidoreductase [Solwaraspora sp. WMMA2056]
MGWSVIDVPLSVLDLAPVAAGGTAGEALRHTTELARRVEQLGYRRFWVAEHHNMPAIASAAPPVLLAHLAAATSTIRVGSGGVMLPNHPPLVVAEQFGTLEALHPGRVDLGIGRAPGTDQATALALRRTMAGLNAEAFPQELAALIGYFRGDPGPITATPGAGQMPAIWLLGSSGFSAQLAGTLGLPFSFAHHFSPANTLAALALYRQHFRPSQWLDRPYAMVAVNVVCADTDEQAEWLSGPAGLSFLRLRSGRPEPLASPAEAAAYPYTEHEREFVRQRRDGQAIGSPDTVARALTELRGRTGADELMLTTLVYDIADRVRSFELVMAAVGRTGVGAAGHRDADNDDQ